nr:uncharacterized protein LOC119168012 [Rhipicephalus microplus]
MKGANHSLPSAVHNLQSIALCEIFSFRGKQLCFIAMFKFALQLLLCTAVINAPPPDFLTDCVSSSEHVTAAHTCILVPQTDIGTYGRSYKLLAESVLQEPSNQRNPKFLNTVYNVTRAAVKDRDYVKEGPNLLLEFTTSQSACLHSRHYTVHMCPPIDDKVNGLCQAVFHYRNSILDIERSWCRRMD